MRALFTRFLNNWLNSYALGYYAKEGRPMTEHPIIVRVRVYPGVDGNYYIGAYSSNGREIFRSSQGYSNHLDAQGAALASWPDAEYEDSIVE